MKLSTKKWLDDVVGGMLMGVLKPCVWLLGLAMRRRHRLEVRGAVCCIKMLGGGSLVIAYPALLGLRQRYPNAAFSLITTPQIKPFAETLGVFDRIDTIDERSLLSLVLSGCGALIRNFRVDTVIDLEVYSRLTSVLSTLTAARNRIGFYLESVFWRKRLHTHLVFFNRSAGVYLWYDAVARLLGAEPAPVEACRERLRAQLGVPAGGPAGARIAIGPGCSEFANERMLTPQQWGRVFEQRLPPQGAELVVLGGAADRPLAEQLAPIAARRPSVRCVNRCGELALADSLRELARCREFWGVDSALLHYARLLGLRCVSYWGPTDPATRLRPIPGLEETVLYQKIPCSPCVHVAEEPPCRGQNLCIQRLFDPTAGDAEHPLWLAWGARNP